MNENEATASKNSDSENMPQPEVPSSPAFDSAGTTSRTGKGAPPTATSPHSAEAAAAGLDVSQTEEPPLVGVIIKHRQRTLQRNMAARTRRLAEHRPRRRSMRVVRRTLLPRDVQPSVVKELRAVLAPLANIIESVVAPIQRMLQKFAEFIRPAWLQAFQKMQNMLSLHPAIEALRSIQERLAAAMRPAFGLFSQVRSTVARALDPLMILLHQTREWTKEFMTAGAKLNRLVDAIFSSRSWSFPDITGGFLATLFETITRWAVWAVFRVAVTTREAIIHDENSEEVVRRFALQVLDLLPDGPLVEAAREALLEDDWLDTDPSRVKSVLRRRIRELHRNHKLIGATKLNYRLVTSLDRSTAGIDGQELTLGEVLADPLTVEDVVLSQPEFRDERIERVLGQLNLHEARVAGLWASCDDMTWETAATEAGQPAEFGERVRRKLRRLGNEFNRRQSDPHRTPVSTGPKPVPAFC
ncbi:hypothetical protein Rhe02_52240 [Rhizocola hellebori]|uniref:Uncharacterized protein n=1 Tax=Rhizocola hellebori TaxID=1392758 RepID=A0A8J3QC13_9ACTN|nr:hypothetical protein [Rhizocola hellebori]GIH07157.1 hypothetical protein Rhe02_52240 [Rhizocola hellebori]